MNLLELTGFLGVSWGLGGAGSLVEEPSEKPCKIEFLRARPLLWIGVAHRVLGGVASSEARSLCGITCEVLVGKLDIGDTAVVELRITDAEGDLSDPTSLVVTVTPPLGDAFELEYLVSPTSGEGDAVKRVSEGVYQVQVDLTEERGAGRYNYRVVTLGAKAAEPGSFLVRS